jgi:acyl carrier protein
MVTLDEVVALARREMRGKARRDAVLDASCALTDIGLSSLQIAEVIFSLEEAHEASFADHLAANAKTLGDLVALANEAIAERSQVGSMPSR